MATIVTRAGKGSPLTISEVDSNFTNLNTDKAELSGATFTGDVTSTGFAGDITGAVLFQAKAGEGLTKGDPVYISGISGNQTVVSKADANDANKMPCFGIVDATVSINANCSVVTFGTLSSLNTSAFSEGDELYISDTGTLSATAPTGEASQLQKIAKVTRSHASAGSIKVMGAGRTNATPNLDDGKFFLGNSSNQSASATFSTSVTGIALPLSGGAMTGAITTNSTFDGRDVATDGTKLDGIEANATVDQTNAEIRTAVEAATDSNVFTDADHTKLNAIEASADVTDTANVTAAGALMDSEVTNLAQVKAFASADYATAAQGTLATNALPKAGGTMTGALYVTGISQFAANISVVDDILLVGTSPTFQCHNSSALPAASAVLGTVSFGTIGETQELPKTATIVGIATSQWSTGVAPTDIVLSTTAAASGSALTEHMRLSSEGDTTFTSDSNPTITLKNTDTSIAADQVIGTIEFRGDDDAGNVLAGHIQQVASNTWGIGDYGSDMVFSVKRGGTGGSFSEKLRLEYGGVKITSLLNIVPSAEPSSGIAGDIYYDSTSNKLRCYNGTTWNNLF